jgi:F-type H+-transporting ATPase subunit b
MLNFRFVRWSLILLMSISITLTCVSSYATAKDDKSASGEAPSHSAMPHDDITHANMSSQAYEVVDWRTDMAFFTAIVFLVLLAVLGGTAWGPISKALEKREQMIAQNIKQAEDAAKDAKSKLAEYDAKLASAASEAQQILADARKDAEATGQRMITSAQEEAARQRDRAMAEIESAKSVALGELASKSTDVAMTLAGRIIGREVKAGDHSSMIQEMLSKLPSKN